MSADDTITLLPPRGAAPRTRHVLHTIFPGSGSVVLRPGSLAIGREPGEGQHAFSADRAMSRMHARVRLSDGTVAVEDAGSHNGTRVNGERVAAARLHDGDILRLGDTFLLYRVEPTELLDAEVPGLAGHAPAVRRLRATLAQFAPTKATVVLLGETGTGKSAAARGLHALSGRRGELVHVNAAAIPEAMAESLLFGHKAGAFTDARADQPGWFRAAQRGTLFLDEVGLLSLATQARLLLAIETSTVTPVGAITPVPVDVRIVVATNEDLAASVAEGRFRADLYARLAEVSLVLPPLRERREDVLPLFLRALGRDAAGLHPDLVALLLGWHWPYNVREIEKLAGELLVRGEGIAALGPEILEGRLDAPAAMPRTSTEPDGEAPPDRERLIELLREVDGNVSELARRTGRSTKQVYRWCARWSVEPGEYRTTSGR